MSDDARADEPTGRWGTVVVWFRRDLRVHDHPALWEAATGARSVVPLFVVDPALFRAERTAPARRAFLAGSIAALDAALRERGSWLVVRTGAPRDVVPAIAAEVAAEAVLVSRDVTPHARRRDRRVAAALEADGRTLRARRGLLLVEPEDLGGEDSRAPSVFSPFWRRTAAMERRGVLPAPDRVPPAPDVRGEPSPHPGPGVPGSLPQPGEAAARDRVDAWVRGGLAGYADGRDRLDGTGSSHLSQDLHLGLLSPVEVESRCTGLPGADAYRRQLVWRDFYHHLLWHRPELAREPFQPRFDGIWRTDPEALEAWRTGRTGIPVVDAGMRQLAATGWLSNRARMVVGSFLTRHLLLDWRHGEGHFMRTLVDGDVANNVGGWQWTAGVGTDSQPWFRILNPVLQGRRFDPAGEWVRRWVPELADLSVEDVHAPWTAPDPPRDYPPPIVDLADARARAIDAFRSAAER
jgi:deoxyribodipyrimidine photo-lyase